MAGVPKILAAFNSLKVAFPTALNVIGNAALAGILFGLETLLEKTTPCPCDPELNNGHVAVVFLVPALILLMVSLMTLPDSRKLLKGWCVKPQETDSPKTDSTNGQSQEAKVCGCCTRKQCHFTGITLLTAFMPSFMWIIILLLDGDHVACAYHTPGSGPGDNQSCVEICSHNPTLSRVCITSWKWGGSLLVVIAFLLMILRILPTCKCSNCTWKGYYQAKYRRKLEKAIEIKMKEEIAKWADEEAGTFTDNQKESVKKPDSTNEPKQRPRDKPDSTNKSTQPTGSMELQDR